MVSLRQTLLNTALAWVANLNDPNGSFSAGRTPDAVHSILPASLNLPQRMSNSEMTDWLITSLPGLHNYTTSLLDDIPITVDEDTRTIVMHTVGTGGQTEIGPYENEYIWVLKATENGTMVQESFEYIDSNLFEKFRQSE